MTHATETDAKEAVGIVLPKWFLLVASSINGLLLPWIFWVSWMIIDMGVRIETHASLTTDMREIDKRVDALDVLAERRANSIEDSKQLIQYLDERIKRLEGRTTP